MTNKQTLTVLEMYVKSIGTPAKKAATSMTPLTMPSILGHLAWMCQQIPGFLEEEKNDKAQRWMGFIQGSMWAIGMRTIDQMREDNR
jgi:hypothetical protein